MAVLDIRSFQNETRDGAKARGHEVGEWQIVDQGDAGKDYHLHCRACGAMYSVRLMNMQQVAPGMTITMHVVAVGVSDLGALECARGRKLN
jgi:hypothetical protein